MGILDLFKKKKKEEWPEIGMPKTGGYGPGMGLNETPTAPAEPVLPGLPPQTATAPTSMAPSVPAAETEALKKEIEAINYKVDALKSTLDIINQRLASIEEAIKGRGGAVY